MEHTEQVEALVGKVVKKAELNELMDTFKITFEDETVAEISCECIKLYINEKRV